MKQILFSLLVVMGLAACTQQTPLEKIDALFKSAAEANHLEWTPERWNQFYIDTYLALAEFYEADPSFEEHNELIELTRKYGEIFERDASKELWSTNVYGDLNVWLDSKSLHHICEGEEWQKASEIFGKAADKWAETHYGNSTNVDLTEEKVAEDEEIYIEESVINSLAANGEIDNGDNSVEDNENRVFDVAEEMPQFKGGDAVLMDYINKNLVYPAEAKDKGIQGRVVCKFIVERDGAISGIKVVKSVDPLLDNEAIRLIKSMPKWNPGKQNGEKVRVYFTLPITFKQN